MSHFFYLARCSDGSLYAGTCIDVAAREAKHNDGTGAKYTRARRPIKIIYTETFETLSEARKREAEIKKWSKGDKEELAKSSS
jgi:putative endonuclease